MCLDCNLIGSDLQILVCEGEHRLVYLDLLAGWVLNDDSLSCLLTYSTDELNLLNVFGLFNSDNELIENVLASLIFLEVHVEFVGA